MRRRRLIVAVTGLLAACSGGVEVPDGAQIRCRQADQCPTGFSCNTTIELCVPLDVERDPPRIVSATLNRPEATAGVALTVDFTVSEPLLASPRVAARISDQLRYPWAVQSRDELSFTAVFTPTGTEVEQLHPIVATLIDVNGNQADDVPVASARLDFHAPTIVAWTATPRSVRAGGTVVVDLEVDEALAEAAVALADGSPLTQVESPEPLVYRFLLAADGSQPDGAMGMVARVEDPAGNVSEVERPAFIFFDYGAPILESSEILAAAVRVGMTAAVALNFNEPLAAVDPAQVELQPLVGGLPVGTPLALELDLVSGTSYLFNRIVTAGDADGPYEVRLVAFQDEAGNQGSGTTLGTLAIDNTPPSLLDLRVGGGAVSSVTGLRTFSAVAGFNDVQVELDIGENLTDQAEPSDNGVLAVTLGGRPLSCSPYSPAMPSHVCTATIDGSLPSGRYALAVVAIDALANVTTLDQTVAIDLDRPELYAATPNRLTYKAGEAVTLSLELSEAVQIGSVAVAVTRDGAPALGFFSLPPGASPTRTVLTLVSGHAMAPADQGDYTVAISAIDDVGNAAIDLVDPSSAFSVDAVAPVISGLSVISNNPNSAAVATLGDEVIATFLVSDLGPIDPEVNLGASSMSLTSVTGSGPFTCVYRRVVSTADVEGTHSVVVSTRDAAGNPAVETIGSVVLDWTPPGIAAGSPAVTLFPEASNPLRTVDRLTFSTRARISFTTDEPLLDEPLLALSPVAGTWSVSLASSAGGHYEYDLVLLGGTPSQTTYQVRLTMSDLAGNTNPSPITLVLPAPNLVVDTVAPTPITTTQNDKIRFTRVPWGAASSGGVDRYTVATIGGQTASVEANATVIIRDGDSAATGSELGRAVADAAGVFSATLVRSDRSAVYLWQVDRAGNVDAAVGTRVRNVEWVATLGRKVAGQTLANPHLYQSRSVFTPSLEGIGAGTVVELGEADGLASIGGTAVTDGSGVWADRSLRDAPAARRGAPMAYDTARGRAVLFGGSFNNVDLPGETWEWDGSTWRLTGGAGPFARHGHAMAYDAARGETILFGGLTNVDCGEGAGAYCDDTWAWDGSEWRVLATTGPSGREGHAMAFDPIRHRVVLFGGRNPTYRGDTWEWDGTAWTQVSSSGPSARIAAAAAFDPGRSSVVLFGGRVSSGTCDGGATVYCASTWSWSGATWTNLNTTGTIVGRVNPALAFNPPRGRLTVFGGDAGSDCGEGEAVVRNCGTTWELNGTAWQAITTGGPVGRAASGLVYDVDRRMLVLYGGQLIGTTPTPDCLEGAQEAEYCGATWLLDGVTWRRAASGPLPRSEAGMAFDLNRRYALLFGGSHPTDCAEGADAYGVPWYCDDTWTWDGVGWTRAATAPGPRGRHGPAMAYFDAGSRPRILLFGGLTDGGDCNEGGGNYCASTWLWCSDCGTPYWYIPSLTGTPPGRRSGASAASFGSTGPTGAVMFGGYLDAPWCSEPGMDYRCGYTWHITWDTSAYRWSTPATTGPTQRFAAAMAFKSDSPYRAVLFGGDYQGHSLLDVQEWNGTTWTQRWNGTPLPSPSPRDHHALTYDASRRRTVLFGGSSVDASYVINCEGTGGSDCPGLWEWNGTTWSNRAHLGPVRRQGNTLVYDPFRQRVVMFGGTSNVGCGEGAGAFCASTWELDSGAAAQPTQAFLVSFAATGDEIATVEVESIEADFYAGGVGRTSAACTTNVNGAKLWVWDKGSWKTIGGGAQNTAAPGAPALLRWSTSTDTEFNGLPIATYRDRVRRLFFGRDSQTLSFAVTPAQPNGCLDAMGQVAVDYAEVRVRYRRP